MPSRLSAPPGALRTLRIYLGRTLRDITRQIAGEDELQDIFREAPPPRQQVREQWQNQRGRKIYSLHAPEVECIGKGKAHAPYEFGVKVSIATTLHRSKGGQFAIHAMTLLGNRYDDHSLATVIPYMEQTIGKGITAFSPMPATAATMPRSLTSSGSTPPARNAAGRLPTSAKCVVEPVIGQIKYGHRMDRNYLAGSQGNAINAVLAATGYNFRLLLNWLRLLLCLIASMLLIRSHATVRLQIA